MSGLVILVPVLARPHRVKPLLASIAASTPPARVVFLCDPDDRAQRVAVADVGAEQMLVEGNYARKINVGVRATTEPLIFLGADDLHFHPGWLPAAVQKMRGRIGVVGTNDLGNPRVVSGRHATHSLVSREYARRGTIDDPTPFKLLHEGYAHNFVDDELVATARRRGAFAFARASIVEHQHPNWGKAQVDATYEKGQASFEQDRRLHRSRRRLWR